MVSCMSYMQMASGINTGDSQKILGKEVENAPNEYDSVFDFRIPKTKSPVKASGEAIPKTDSQNGGSKYREQLKFCSTVLRTLKKHKDAGPFLVPVDPVLLNIPDYFNVIKSPMDLSTIEKKLTSGKYEMPEEFFSDVNLMLSNCFTYNAPEHPVHLMGRNLEKSFSAQIKRMPVEGSSVPSAASTFASNSVPNHSPSSRPKREIHAPHRDYNVDLSRKKSAKYNAEMKWCQSVHKELLSKKHEQVMFIFYRPVDVVALNIPTYLDIIKHPMDLSTIKRKLDNLEYENLDEFESDVRLMLNNCFTFNPSDSDVFQMGKQVEKIFDSKWSEKPDFTSSSDHQQTTGSTSKKSTKKKRSHEGSSSSGDDDETKNIQVQMLEQQMLFIQQQLNTIKQSRSKKSKKDNKKRPSISSEQLPHAPVAPKTTAPAPSAKPKSESVAKKPKKEPRVITFEEKKQLSEAINNLEGNDLARVVQIIKEGMSLPDNDQEEIELDMDTLDPITLNKLYDFVKGDRPKKRGPRKKKETEANTEDASRINELEMEIARMDGRMDKAKKLKDEKIVETSAHSSSDSSEGGVSDSELSE